MSLANFIALVEAVGSNVPYFYHATASPRLAGIIKSGLRTDVGNRNWKFSDNPENVIFVADTEATALYYGRIVASNYYHRMGYPRIPYVVLLRVRGNQIKVVPDRNTRGEYYTTQSIPVGKLEIKLHDTWKRLATAPRHIIEFIIDGSWDDFVDDDVGNDEE
jgi:hypothetical protein